MATSITAPAKTRHMAEDSLFRRMVGLAVLANIAALFTGGYLLLTAAWSDLWIYCSTIIALALAGSVTTIIIWRRRQTDRTQSGVRLAILLPALTLLVMTFSIDAFGELYGLWLLACVVLALTGRRSLMWTIPATIIYLAARQAVVTDQPWSILWTVMTAGSFVTAYLVAQASDHSSRTVQLAEGLSNRLDGAEMQEQLMMNAIADAVVGVDLQRRVVVFNAAAQRLTGWDDKSAAAVEYNLIFKLKDSHDNELTAETDPFAKVIASQQPQATSDLTMMSKKGDKIAFSISIAPTLDSHGKISGAIGIFHDISDQQALARERNEFVSTASHEMRTPVAAIEGYISMAMNPKLAVIDERAKGFLTKAHDSSVHLGQLFKDLLSVTKIEDNRVAINIRNFNISELIGQLVNEMTIIAAAKDMHVEAQIGGSGLGREKVVAPLYEVTADPERVREVMANLVDNAIKYSSQGTIIVRAETDKDSVVISVIDQGVGISAEDQKHLFQKFYRVNSSFTREVGGTGLGLYIARNLIERFGGRIWVESQEGKGSAFRFTLPLAKP